MVTRELLLLIFLSVVLALARALSESVFLTRPKLEPYYVKEGEEGPVLDCSFAAEILNRTRYEPSWDLIAGGKLRHLTRNDENFARTAYELLQNDARYSLRLKTVNFHQTNGKYICGILDRGGENQVSVEANVIVLVPPEKPVITKQPEGPVLENQFVTIECASSSGNPLPEFVWRFSNNSLVVKEWYHVRPPRPTTDTSVSILQWRVGAAENHASLTCEIWNRALPEGQHYSVTSKSLNVYYSPKVEVGPVKEYNVQEGEFVEITCTADGNPEPTQFEWYSVSTGERYGSPTWRFKAEKKLSGDFRCTAKNSVDSGHGKLTLNVLFKPIVAVQEIYNPAEGETVTLKCTTDAKPPVSSVMWQTPNGSQHDGSHLTLTSLTRADSGNYTCFAKNTMNVYGNLPVDGTGSAVSFVDVLAKPGKATITASEEVAIAGMKVVLTCGVSDAGSPKAQYRWKTVGVANEFSELEKHTANFITLEPASLEDSGEYRCTPYNSIGEGEEARYLLEVVEPPKITKPLPDSQELRNGEAVLVCQAEGYPAPEISWLKDGYDITDSDVGRWSVVSQNHDNGCAVGKYCLISVTSELKFVQKLEWSDKGIYTCLARNNLAAPVERSSSRVSVFHNPVILNERYQNEALTAADDGTAFITCRVSAHPAPRIEWEKGGIAIHNGNSRYSIHTKAADGKVDEVDSVLKITNLAESDYGAYVCRAWGDSGAKTDINIKLQPKSRPQPPRNLRVFSIASDSLLIGWQPGFDGGRGQTFQIEYRKTNPWKEIPDVTEPTSFYANERNVSTIVVYGDGNKFIRQRRFAEPSTFMVYNITDLAPLTNFWLRIKARNSLGESEWTPILTATTTDVFESPRLPRPQSLVYNTNERKIEFQESEMNGLCLLLLVSTKDNTEADEPNWRTVGCYFESPIPDVDPATQFRARFCLRQNISVCSKPTDIVVTATLLASAWKYALPGAVIAISFVLLALTLLVCCFLRKHSICGKTKLKQGSLFEKKRPDVSAPLPQGDGKNAVVHGSHSDSGIFTLGSLPNNQPVGQQNLSGSPENPAPFDATVNDWCSSDANDFSNDPYVHEYGSQYISGKDAFPGPPSLQGANFFYDGFSACESQPFGEQRSSLDGLPTTIYEDQEDSDEASCSASGGRRIMREIIV